MQKCLGLFLLSISDSVHLNILSLSDLEILKLNIESFKSMDLGNEFIISESCWSYIENSLLLVLMLREIHKDCSLSVEFIVVEEKFHPQKTINVSVRYF